MTFPSYRPNTRTLTNGEYSVKQFRTQNGVVARRLYGSLPSNYRLSLGYTLLTDSQVESVLDHFDEVKGSFSGFQLPVDIFSGTDGDLESRLNNLPSIQWHYANPPVIETPFGGRHNVTIELEGSLDFG